jgi:hypothetical protein
MRNAQPTAAAAAAAAGQMARQAGPTHAIKIYQRPLLFSPTVLTVARDKRCLGIMYNLMPESNGPMQNPTFIPAHVKTLSPTTTTSTRFTHFCIANCLVYAGTGSGCGVRHSLSLSSASVLAAGRKNGVNAMPVCLTCQSACLPGHGITIMQCDLIIACCSFLSLSRSFLSPSLSMLGQFSICYVAQH